MDYAQRLVSLLNSAGPQRVGYARALASGLDRNGDHLVDGAEFQHLFATLLVDPTRMPEVTGAVSSVHKTIFAQTLYPSFSRNHAIAAYLANGALDTLDQSGDGKVSVEELDGTYAPPTAAQRADDLLAKYDTDAKGYIDLADIKAAWAADPSLGDASKAQAAIDAFDQNADGKVTHDELVAGYQAMDRADALLAAFDPQNTGAIDIAQAAKTSSAEFADAQAKFAGWDADKDGKLTRAELIAGLEAADIAAQQPKNPPADPVIPTDADPALLAATLLAQYDSDRSGGISLAEFTTHAQVSDPAGTFAAWDTHADGELTLEELQTGIAQVQQAQNIVSQYDTAKKGWLDAADLAAAIDPATVDDVAARALQIMSFWDANGDGKVTIDEVIRGIEAGGYVGGEQLKANATATPAV
jgi:Ca2+-binding EF-hand superfamily protein